jgi:dolichol-phosphate mannosyltransferase
LKLECLEIGFRKVCVLEDWLTVVQERASLRGLEEGLIVVDSSPLHRLILRVLGFKKLGSVEGGMVVGFVDRERADRVNHIRLTSRDLYKLYSTKLPKAVALLMSEPARVATFLAVGGSGVLVNLLIAESSYRALVSALGPVANTAASALGFEASVVSNFTLNELLTFRNTGLSKSLRDVLTRLAKYHGASLASLASQVSMANIIPFIFKTPFWVGQLVGILLGFLVNLILGYIYTWSMHRLK